MEMRVDDRLSDADLGKHYYMKGNKKRPRIGLAAWTG